MSRVKLETLTAVHVGSGTILQYNTDFVVSGTCKDCFIDVIDERKILHLIGVEHLNDWVLSIEKKESTIDLVSRYAPDKEPEDYSKRALQCYARGVGKNPTETLKECIHNGMGLAYIPGSSIKGAIRTAILVSLIDEIKDKENKIKIENRDRKITVTAKKIEEELFGNDPNEDIFRFIQVGDAYFERDCEIATRLININIRNAEDDLKDISKPQLVEAIGPEFLSEFELKISIEQYEYAKEHFTKLRKFPEGVKSLHNLFVLINQYTHRMVQSEIEYWGTCEKEGADAYLEKMNDILDAVETCEKEGKSCILRLGHASGWRFITGGWAENLSCFQTTVVPASRPNNHRYEEYDFPKTRRLDEDSDILGFIKLSYE